jgi:uncharacterized protein
MTLITEEDLDRFTRYVRTTMFEDAAGRETPEDVRDFWPFITPEYRFQHSLHVRRFVEKLQEGEGGDLDVLRTAAVFHDISHFRVDYSVHGRVSAEMARDYLISNGYPAPFVDLVHLTVDDHSSEKPDSYYREELPIESQLLIEADLLDKLGPVAVTSTILLCGHNRQYWGSIEERVVKYVIGRGNRALNHPVIRFTPTGRRLVEERLAWTRRFLEEMKEDVACLF